MKKTISLLATLLTAASSIFGQYEIKMIPFEERTISGQSPNKTFDDPITPLATAQRCVRAANYLDGVLYDSIQYYYGGVRGTISTKDNLEPTNNPDSIYRYDVTSGTFYLGSKLEYDNENRFVSGQYYSSIPPHTQNGTGAAQYSSNGVRTFYETNFDDPNVLKQYRLITNNSEGKILKDTFYQNAYSSPGNNWLSSSNYDYDGSGRQIFFSRFYSYNNFAYSNATTIKSFYNQNSNVPYLDSTTIITIAGMNNTSKRATYHYYDNNQKPIIDSIFDQNGNINSVVNYTYAGNTITATTRFNSSGNWISTSRNITKSNNDNIETHNEHQTWNSNSNSWVISSGDSAIINNNDYIIERTSYIMNNGNIVPNSRQKTERNNFNNSVKNTYQGFDGQGNVTSERKAYYYYTEYDDGTGVKNIKQPLNVSVFPNPTSNQIQIKVIDYTKGFTLKLWDINGKELKNQSFKTQETILNLSDLSSGIYQLLLSTQDNSAQYSQKIIKQ